jgi:hypothetical protein
MQFRHALQRILEIILNANLHFGPVYLIKVNIANGFYRVWVNTTDIPKLGVIFPPYQTPSLWSHHLDSIADTLPPPEATRTGNLTTDLWQTIPEPPRRQCPHWGLAHKPLGTFNVFVDDAIGMAQGGTLHRQRLC